MRRGLFGGSFDPFHAGHRKVLEEITARRGLDGVDLVPAFRPPHKPGLEQAPFEHRVEMAKLGIQGLSDIDVLDLESRRQGPSYTVDTVRTLRETRPAVEIELFVGADMLEDLPRWRDASLLARLVQVVAFARPEADVEEARRVFAEGLPGAPAPVVVRFDPLPFSSTEVRRRFREGLPLAGALHPDVEAYARARGLYGASAEPP